ncbi:Ig-like domain-containing protein, partial [Desulfococcaceae bacterium OttesenSCG-928-F15]|nr:Ig-like domain-containing protein [Desulfococcaceae bacterium OttesenSCG-928-F15]
MTNGNTTRLGSFFVKANGADKTLLLQESNGTLWQAVFSQKAGYTVMEGYAPYTADPRLLEKLPPAQNILLDRDATWDGYGIEIKSYTDDAGFIKKDYPGNTQTDDATPTLNGTVEGAQPGDQVRIYEGDKLLGTAEIDADGNWSFEIPETADGSHYYTARIVNAYGVESDLYAKFGLCVDTHHLGMLPPWLIAGLGVGTGLAFILGNNSSSKKHVNPGPDPEPSPVQEASITAMTDTNGVLLSNGCVTNCCSPSINCSLTVPLKAGETLCIYRTNIDNPDAPPVRIGTYTAEQLGNNTTITPFLDAGLHQGENGQHTGDGTYEYTAMVLDAAGNI